MGTIQHHTVIVTTWNISAFEDALDWISTIEKPERYLFLSGESLINNYNTIVLLPSGSNVDWDTYEDHLILAKAFEKELKKIGHFEIVHVEFGELGDAIRRII